MSNNLTTLDPILIDQKALFDFLTTGETIQNIDNLALLEAFVKATTDTIKEVKTYLGSTSESVKGSNCELVAKTLGGDSTIYNPHKVFQKLLSVNSDFAKEFMASVKVSKTEVKAFADSHEMKVKDFSECFDAVTKPQTISYQLKTLKI